YFPAAEFGARDSSEERHYWHLHRRRVVLHAVRRLARTSARLIELGCGVGTVSTYLNGHGYRGGYAGVPQEALDPARQIARERLGAAAAGDRLFLQLDITRESPLPHYEGILLLDVLEHLPDDLGVLRRIGEALAGAGAGAFLLLTVPAFPALWSRWDEIE